MQNHEQQQQLGLAAMLGLGDSPMARDAYALARTDYEYHRDLIRARKASGLTVEQVAERVGKAPDDIREFEKYWYDPSLSELRRYALAVGVIYTHRITKGEQ